MSTTVDNRVVEMQFDNSRFEKNVSTSISTLDKLKQSLNFTGASKGLENVQAAAKNVNMAGLGSAVESVQAKFSAMQVVGMTALANITNSAVNAGKRLVSAFTIDPIKTGFSEYEMKMDSVKTIMASTGESVEKVNGYLEELNKYSDQTIYSFSDMTQNIGKFTNAGVKLEDAVLAIQGISNEAAVSGANANEASRAMYNFAQALSSGYVKLIDWKSIENANMATVEFKQQLIDAAVHAGTLTEGVDGMYNTLSGKSLNATQNFNDTLQEQWMTSEVLINTLKNYASTNTDIGKKAFAAAQDVTKFTQMMDVLKETAQSGWARTWEILVGDIETAKAMFTPLTNFFSGIIEKISEARNKLLESALGKSFTNTFNALTKGLSGIKERLNGITEPIKTVTKTLEDYQNVVKEVIRGGKWGHTQERWDALTKAGYDWATVQNMVNEQLGNSKRHATDFVIGQEKVTESTEESAEANRAYIAMLAKKEDWELRLLGLNEWQIKTIRDLQKEADKLGLSTEEFLANIDNIDGRWVLLESLKNVGSGIVGIFKAMAAAWREIFDPMMGDQLYDIIAGFHKFSLNLRLTDKETGKLTETGLKFQRVFKGIFAILDIVTTILGGGLKIAFKAVSALFKYFGMDVLDVAAWIGDAAVKLRDWIDSLLDFENHIGKIAKPIENAVTAIKDWVAANVDFTKISNRVKNIVATLRSAFGEFFAAFDGKRAIIDPKYLAKLIIDAFGSLFDAIGEIFDKLKADLGISGGEVAGGFIIGFANRIWNGLKYIGQVVWNVGEMAMTNLIESLDPESPLRKALEMGGNIVQGLAQGIADWAPKAWAKIVEFGEFIIERFKELLGIHSPSTVFMAIGGFIIAGLLLGIQEGFISVPESLKGIVDKCVNVIQNVDWGAVLAAGTLIGGLLIFKKFTDILENFSAPFGALGEVFEETAETIKSFKKVTNAMASNLKADAIKKLAVSLAILVAAVVVIVKICGDDYGKMWNAVGIIVVLAGVLVGLAWAMSLISDASVSFEKGKGLNIEGIKSGLLSIAVAIGILALSVKLLSGIDADQAKQGFIGLAGIATGIIIFFAAIQGLSIITKGGIGDNIDKIGSMMIKISFSLLLMVGVCKLAGKLSDDELKKGLVFFAAFGLFTAALTLIGKTAGSDISKVGGMMLKMSIAMALMVGVCKLASKLKPNEMKKGALFALAFVGFVKLLVLATKTKSGTQIAKLGGMLISISLSMVLMIGICKLLSTLSTEDMIKGGIFALAFAVFVGLLVKVVSIASDKQIAKVSGTIIAISVAIGVMALVAALLSFMSIEGLLKGVTAVGILSLMMATMIKSLKGAQNVVKSLIVITVAIAVMAAAVALLSLIDSKKLAVSAGSMALLMGVFALIVKSVQSLKGVEKVAGKLVIMTLAIAALAGILWLLSTIDAKLAIPNAIALSILVVAMSGAMVLLSKMSTNAANGLKGVLLLTAMAIPLLAFVGILALMSGIQNALVNVATLTLLATAMTLLLIPLTLIGNAMAPALKGVIALTAMAIPLLAFVGVLALMQNVQNATTNALALSALVAVLSIMLIPLAIVGAFAVSALFGVLALTAMAIPLLAFVGVLALMQNVQNASTNVQLLTQLLTVMTGVLFILAIVGPLALVGVAAMTALTILMVGIGALVVAIGALMTKFPQLQEFIDVGMPVLEQLANGIGSIIGNLVAGFMGAVADGLPDIGTKLSEFITNAMPFINGVKMVDGAVLEGVAILAGAILALTAADVITGIVSFLSGGSSFADLGTELSLFMMNAMPFIAGASMLNETMMNGVKALAETILILTAANVLEGLTSWFTGGNTLGSFAQQLPILGQGIADFIASVGSLDESKVAIATHAANIIKTLAAAAQEIPNTGGLLGQLVGENDMGTWAEQLPKVGEGIAGFITAVGEIGEAQVETATTAAEIIKTLASAAQEIPNTGGLLAQLIGDNDMVTWAAQLPEVGKGISGFMANLGEIDSSTAETAKIAAEIIGTLAAVAQDIPNTGGLLASIIGDNDLSTFASGLPSVGEGIAGFMSKVSGYDEASVSSVDVAVKAIKALTGLAGADLSGFKKNVEGFGEKLAGLGKDIASFGTAMKDVEVATISTAVTNVNRLVSMLKNMAGIEENPAKTFKSAIKKIGETGFDKFKEALNGDAAKTDIKKAAEDMVENAAKGAEEASETFEKVVTHVVKAAVSAIKTEENKSSFYNAGSYLVDGFTNGISENSYKASAKAAAMAAAAKKAAEEALGINSPSKVFYQIGSFTGQGFVNALNDYGTKTYNAGSEMGDSAKNGFSEAIDKIRNAINGDIDMQPTISPVLDLSNIKSGAGAISGMFGSQLSVGAIGNVNAVSSLMNNNRQNGGNDDIVSAIEDLRKDISNIESTSYTINGITYDDGTNISEAVKTLTRAALIERRV